MTERINPLAGALSTFQVMADQAMGRPVPGREDVFRDEWDGILVDTCAAFDTGRWETGIERDDGPMVIVEQYEERTAAEAGHKVWVEKLRADRNTALEDIDLWGLNGGDE